MVNIGDKLQWTKNKFTHEVVGILDHEGKKLIVYKSTLHLEDRDMHTGFYADYSDDPDWEKIILL